MEIARTPDGALALRANPAELDAIADGLDRVARARQGEARWPLEAPGDASAPGGVRAGEATLPAQLVAERDGDPVRVRDDASTGRLVLRGGWALLHLAAWFRALADRPGRRVRLAWYRGHLYLAERSVPLEIEARPAGTA